MTQSPAEQRIIAQMARMAPNNEPRNHADEIANALAYEKAR